MGQHKFNATAIAASKGEIVPKKKPQSFYKPFSDTVKKLFEQMLSRPERLLTVREQRLARRKKARLMQKEKV